MRCVWRSRTGRIGRDGEARVCRRSCELTLHEPLDGGHCADKPQLSRRLSSDRIVPPAPTRVSPAHMSMNSAMLDSTACQYLDPKSALAVR
jgi:hypothetical protein